MENKKKYIDKVYFIFSDKDFQDKEQDMLNDIETGHKVKIFYNKQLDIINMFRIKKKIKPQGYKRRITKYLGYKITGMKIVDTDYKEYRNDIVIGKAEAYK